MFESPEKYQSKVSRLSKKTVVQLRKNPVGKLDIAQIPAQMLPNSCCRQAKICWLFFKDFS